MTGRRRFREAKEEGSPGDTADVGSGGGVAVFEGALFLGLSSEDLVVAIGVEGGIDIDEVDAAVGELAKLVEVVAAVDDAGIEERRRFGHGGIDFPHFPTAGKCGPPTNYSMSGTEREVAGKVPGLKPVSAGARFTRE